MLDAELQEIHEVSRSIDARLAASNRSGLEASDPPPSVIQPPDRVVDFSMKPGCCSCCRLRAFVGSLGVVLLLVQIGFLISNIVLLWNIETHVRNGIEWLHQKSGGIVQNSAQYLYIKNYLVERSPDYTAIPITINVLLILSNLLLLWSVGVKNKLLVLPWLLAYGLLVLGMLAFMIYLLVNLPRPWFKVITFLVLAPLVVILSFLWFVVKCFFSYLKNLKLKKEMATVYRTQPIKGQPGGPATVYTPEPHSWDHPVPIWAIEPPKNLWDPDYLRQHDPRYTGGEYDVTEDDDDLDEEGEVIEESTGRSATSYPESVRSFSNKYSADRAVRYPISDDHSSVVSLSDKYHRVEYEFADEEEFYPRPPPPRPLAPIVTVKGGRRFPDADASDSEE